MRDYIVSGRSAVFGPGYVLLLTAAQAAPRAHNLRNLAPAALEERAARRAVEQRLQAEAGSQLVTPEAPVEFKLGERITIVVGSVGKVGLEQLAEPGSLKAEAVADALERKAARAITAKEKRAIKAAAAAEAAETAASRKKKKVVRHPDTGQPVNATQAAVDLAVQVSVEIGSVKGSGPDGLVRAADVQAAREELARDTGLPPDPAGKKTIAAVTQHDAR